MEYPDGYRWTRRYVLHGALIMIDPRILQAIGNPTGGKLTDIGTLAYNVGKSREQMKMKRESMAQEMAIVGSKVANAYANAALDWKMENPEASDEEFAEYQLAQWESLDPAHRQFVPQDFQTKEQLETGKSTTERLLERLDPSRTRASTAKKISTVTRVEDDGTIYKKDEVYKDGEMAYESPEYPVSNEADGSEFERHINWFKSNDIPMDKPDQWYRDNLTGDKVQEALVRKKRLGTRAGLEQTRQQELTYKSTQTENRRDIESRLRGEYAKGIDAYKSMSSNIEAAITAMSSGDTALADTMMAQTLSQVQESDVRAFQMYSQFDKSFGNVLERTVKGMRRFLEGKRTPGERAEIQRTLEYMRDNYAEPKTTAVRDRYRADAIEEGLDPFKALPPESPEDIRDSTLVDKEEKLKLLRKYYPGQFRKEHWHSMTPRRWTFLRVSRMSLNSMKVLQRVFWTRRNLKSLQKGQKHHQAPLKAPCSGARALMIIYSILSIFPTKYITGRLKSLVLMT